MGKAREKSAETAKQLGRFLRRLRYDEKPEERTAEKFIKKHGLGINTSTYSLYERGENYPDSYIWILGALGYTMQEALNLAPPPDAGLHKVSVNIDHDLRPYITEIATEVAIKHGWEPHGQLFHAPKTAQGNRKLKAMMRSVLRGGSYSMNLLRSLAAEFQEDAEQWVKDAKRRLMKARQKQRGEESESISPTTGRKPEIAHELRPYIAGILTKILEINNWAAHGQHFRAPKEARDYATLNMKIRRVLKGDAYSIETLHEIADAFKEKAEQWVRTARERYDKGEEPEAVQTPTLYKRGMNAWPDYQCNRTKEPEVPEENDVTDHAERIRRGWTDDVRLSRKQTSMAERLNHLLEKRQGEDDEPSRI